MTPLSADKARDASQALAAGLSQLLIDKKTFAISAEAEADLLAAFSSEMTKIDLPLKPNGIPARLRVNEINTRSVAARVMFGRFSGNDDIKGTVSGGGAECEVEDTGVTAFSGLGVIPRNIGVQAAGGVRNLSRIALQQE